MYHQTNSVELVDDTLKLLPFKKTLHYLTQMKFVYNICFFLQFYYKNLKIKVNSLPFLFTTFSRFFYIFFTPYHYSMLFSDSTISIFFNLKYITQLINKENIQVNNELYKKLKKLIFLPNINISTSTVKIT